MTSTGVKITALPDASTVTGAEEVPLVQGTTTRRMTVDELLLRPPGIRYFWWYCGTVGQVIANNQWTPIDWTQPEIDLYDQHMGFTQTTTIAAGSNGAALPQGTIHVASTTGFEAATATFPQWISVTISAKTHVVQYTGMTGTSFTGCSLGTGTLLTGQAVRQANVRCKLKTEFHSQIAEVAFAVNANGSRGIRYRDQSADAWPFYFVGAQTGPLRVSTTSIAHIQVAMQAGGSPIPDGSGPAVYQTVEVFQDSGGALEALADGIASPSWMSAPTSRRWD